MIDLAALRSQLLARGSPLILAASDATLPAELHGFLAGLPGSAVTLSPGADGITLAGSALAITGQATASWPVQGLTGVTVTLTSITIKVSNASGASVVTGQAAGSMPVASQQVAVALASAMVQQTPAWTLTTAAGASGLRATDLLAFGQGRLAIGPAVPAGLDVLDKAVTIRPSGLQVTFFPGTTFAPWLTVDLQVPDAQWTPISGLLDFSGIDVGMFLAPGSYSVTLTSHLTVDGIAVDVGVGMTASPHWVAFVRPSSGTSFPGLAALAGWLCGAASGLAGRTTASFSGVGFNLAGFDAAISSVRVSFDISQRSLDFVEVISLLTIKALQLDVAVRFPDLTLYGGLHDNQPLNVANVLNSFGIGTEGVPDQLTVSQASFSAQPALGLYSIDLVLDDVWSLGPVAMEQAALLVAHDSLDGFTGSASGLFSIGPSIELMLTADYAGAPAYWSFAGTTAGSTGMQVGELIDLLALQFGIATVPQALRTLSLTDVTLAYQTGTRAFSFGCTGTFEVADTPVQLTIEVNLTAGSGQPAGGPAAPAWTADYHGQLTIGGLVFAGDFDIGQDGSDQFAASYHHDGDATTVSLRDLVASVSAAAAAQVPAELSIGLTDVKFCYVRPAGASAGTFAIGLGLSAQIVLSQLPLIGDQLPAAATLAVTDLQLLYSSAAIGGPATAVANRLLAASHVMPFPTAGLGAGVALTAQLQVGTDQETISLGVPAGPAQAVAGALAASAQDQGAGAWVSIQRTIGVLTVNRVGLLYQHNAVLFALDAAIRLGPLGLSLDGLAAGSALTAFRPVFSLDGLGLRYAEGPLQVTGALLRVPDSALPSGVTMQFDGSALVQSESFGLAAVGSWATLAGGQPSLFVFANYDQPIGGPPALFVTGLMAGFGYNRALTLPAQQEVAGFPLLLLNQPAQDGRPAPDAGTVLAVLEGSLAPPGGGTARHWIAPQPGSDWLAVGVVFTSFELVRSRALLVAEFGDDLVFALLGTSTLQLPLPAESLPTYVYAELDLEAVLKPAEGLFGLTAVLSPSSYVLTPACHLTGGFALSAWFGGNPEAGQFVVTLGGYHPAFVPPAYYPNVPRAGFSWAVSDDVSISGSAYFALTPSCAMAGAALAVVFHDGDLSAWFTANADMLVSWRPFFFTATIAVSIGVSYRLNLLFCHKTISLSIGANVTLWGPPTGGQVHVDLWIISFTVAFGAGRPAQADQALHWPEFAGLLPAPSAAVTVVAASGLLTTIDSTASSSGKKWVVRARDFRFFTQSAVPASHLRYGDTPVTAPADAQNYDGAPVSVRPMNLAGLSGVHRVKVGQGGVTSPAAPLTGWSLTPRTASLPESLWGAPPVPFTQTPASPSASVLPGQLVGYDIQAQPPVAGGTRGVFALAELALQQLTPGSLPLVPQPVPDPRFVPAPSATTVGLIAAVATAAPARTAIRDMLALAGVYSGPAGSLDQMAANAQHLFTDSPMREG